MDWKDKFEKYSEKVENEIMSYLKNKKPDDLYVPLNDLFSRGGKRVRPGLILLSTEAVGGNVDEALKSAAAMEMIHNFTLVHDDIADKSELRRGEPCLHIKYGVPATINAGDGLFAFVYEVLSDNFDVVGDQRGKDILKVMAKSVREVCEGQAMDIGWSHRKEWNITEEDYLTMLDRKTAALISASCECGAIIGNATKKQREALSEFGRKIGRAFQIHDDYLNLTGDIGDYGKEIGGDINEGKRTLIIFRTFRKCTPQEKRRLIEILDKETNTKSEIEEAIEIIKKYGSLDEAKTLSEKLISEAKEGLGSIPDSGAKDALLDIAEYFIRRTV